MSSSDPSCSLRYPTSSQLSVLLVKSTLLITVWSPPQAHMYLGLLVMCGFVLFDTQLIIEKAEHGDKDYVWWDGHLKPVNTLVGHVSSSGWFQRVVLLFQALCGPLPGLHHHLQETHGHPRHERQGSVFRPFAICILQILFQVILRKLLIFVRCIQSERI